MSNQSGFGFYRAGATPSSVAAQSSTVSPATGEAASASPETEEPTFLADDAEIDLAHDEAATKVHETLSRLDAELIGLAGVKQRVREIASLLLVDRARERFGLTTSKPTLHMSFTGGPGTGKTTVAMRMAEILYALGYLRNAKVHAVTRDDLVGQFIGHTSPKTKEAIAKAAGGVLFIDEAYALFRQENERDYGQEAIEILLTEMENERGSLVVIFAGYADRMGELFEANPGLSSRVPHHIAFTDYSHDELMQIADLMVDKEHFEFDEAARQAFDEYLAIRKEKPNFSNARSVRNAIERTRLRQARRLVELDRPITKTDLVTLTEDDVRGSSHFAEDDEPAAEQDPTS